MAVKSLQNVLVDYNSNSLEEHLNTHSLAAVVASIDTTVLSSSGSEKIAGLVDWTVNVGGPWSTALHNFLNPDAVAPPSTLRTLAVTIGESGDQVTYTWTTNAFVGEYSFAVEPTGAITWTGVLAVSGAPVMS